MAQSRVVYQDWIVGLGFAPREDRDGSRTDVEVQTVSTVEPAEEYERRQLIQREVARALTTLTEDEREFIERFYYSGESYRQIAEKSGRAIYKLEAIHKRALRKLKKELRPLVARLYNLEKRPVNQCPICNSPYRVQIDLLIKHRDKSSTWKEIIRKLREEFNLKIDTPQILIGHEKYH